MFSVPVYSTQLGIIFSMLTCFI